MRPFLSFNPSQFGLTGFVLNRQFPYVYGMCTIPGRPSPTLCRRLWRHADDRDRYANPVTGLRVQAHLQRECDLGPRQSHLQGRRGTDPRGLHGRKLPGSVAARLQQRHLATFHSDASFNGYSTGFGYASFLLGDYTSTTQNANELFRRNGYQQWALFVQDSWKVTRKLTVDYGLRWDYATPEKEQYGRLGQLNATLPNTNAGGEPGAIQYASTCNCSFYKPSYPYAIGPRLGVAYQMDPKTVIRGGWGVNYQFIANAAGGVFATNGVYPLAGVNPFVNISTPGSIVAPTWPVTNPNVYPVAGTVGGLPGGIAPDQNENRPPRINQWSIGFQREITPNFIMEASYVANRAVWIVRTSGRTEPNLSADLRRLRLVPVPRNRTLQLGKRRMLQFDL